MSESIISQLVRDNIKQLHAYKSARGTAKAMDGVLLLDAAENPYTPFDDLPLAGTPADLNRYPEPQPPALRERLSDLYGVTADSIVLTRGSEEGIRLVMQVFCKPGEDAILTCPPTFGMYPIESVIHDVKNIQVPRIGDNFAELDVATISKAAKDPANRVKVVFICNPGNPASTSLPVEQIDAVIDALNEVCMVVVDEAYIEFAGHKSFTSRVGVKSNVIVLRTLSKSYGLAGIRLGAIVADEEAVAYVRKMIAAYPVPRSTLHFAQAALADERVQKMQRRHELIKAQRVRMIAELSACVVCQRVLPSDTNFLCVLVSDPAVTVQALRDQGILVRDRSAAIPNALNVAIGTPEQNEKVIQAFQSLG